MKTLITIGLLLAAQAAISQTIQHAPSIQQCRADQSVWLNQLETDGNLPSVNARTLYEWAHEMEQCQQVDSLNLWKYQTTESESHIAFSRRLMSFVQRHNLWAQFVREDQAGAR